ncbi:hypothetical protein E2C01_060550 [Portunus trituberculatus]|uniref:Uncharacterized protein n=1 Tax=Portunus trituberculatus TaxID=210409 RepID=A0A5B7H8E0_PORTR|nr:hypothetical protein [Portunus trituberculatus]
MSTLLLLYRINDSTGCAVARRRRGIGLVCHASRRFILVRGAALYCAGQDGPPMVRGQFQYQWEMVEGVTRAVWCLVWVTWGSLSSGCPFPALPSRRHPTRPSPLKTRLRMDFQ